ncbi:hypothetical protein LY76DRAFT_672896, partial [Colletotrichum caudatum]
LCPAVSHRPVDPPGQSAADASLQQPRLWIDRGVRSRLYRHRRELLSFTAILILLHLLRTWQPFWKWAEQCKQVSTGQYDWRNQRTASITRGSTTALVYRKAPRLDLSSPNVSPSGALTLVGTDAETISHGITHLHEVWGGLLEIGIGVYLIYRQLGAACAMPVVLVFVVLFITAFFAILTDKALAEWIKASQDRVSTTSKTLGSIKWLKISGHNGVAFSVIQEPRFTELDVSRRFGVLLGVSMIFSSGRGDTLTLQKAFTAYSLLILVNQPLVGVIMGLPLAAVTATFQRIQDFLNGKERKTNRLITGSLKEDDNTLMESLDSQRPNQKTVPSRHLKLLELQKKNSGENTTDGSKGISMSGGQKHRLAIARALYAREELLLLDDVFSGLDSGVNRFSQDLQLIDRELPSAALGLTIGLHTRIPLNKTRAIQLWFHSGLAFGVARFIMISVSSRYMAAILPFLIPMRRPDIKHKAPLYSQLIETLHGGFGDNQSLQLPAHLPPAVAGIFRGHVDCGHRDYAVTLVTTLREQIGPWFVGVALTNILSFGGIVKAIITSWDTLEVSLGAVAWARNFTLTTGPEGDSETHLAEPEGWWPSRGAVEICDATASYSQAKKSQYEVEQAIRLNLDPTETAPDSEIVTVLEKVQLWAKVAERGGLDAVIDDTFFSWGEAQLLVLARAVLRKGKVLMLDEISSSLNEESGRVVNEGQDKKSPYSVT